MLLQFNSQNVQNTQFSKFSKFWKFSKSLKFSKFLKIKFKPCQMMILKYSYDTIWCNRINSCHSKTIKTCLDMSWSSKTSRANWFVSTNMSRLVILLWYDLIWFFKHVQTCFNVMIRFDMILYGYMCHKHDLF